MRISSRRFFPSSELGLDGLRPVVLLDALAREDLHADDDPPDARQGSWDHRDVAGFFAEDRAEQFLPALVSPFGVTLLTRMSPASRCADADDPLAEVAQNPPTRSDVP
jgi:hypothetical protein